MHTSQGLSAPSTATIKQWKVRGSIPEGWLTTILVAAQRGRTRINPLDFAEEVMEMTARPDAKELREPGWDMRAIAGVAKDYYGSIPGLFRSEGWEWAGSKWLSVANPRIVEKYGSIENFVKAHG
jgi:hypothetical protein